MDIERARFNMVEQQIRPWDVLDQEILDLLFVVRREDFVPAPYRLLAFTDMELPLKIDGSDTGERMFAPKVEARILQDLGVRKHETVLEIGSGSGHMAALLAHRARHVDTLEIRPELVRFASDNLQRAGVANVAVREADGSRRDAVDGRYDVVVLSGSVPFVPDHLLQRLNPGGRLAAIVGEPPVMYAQIISRATESEHSFVATTMFETSALPLRGFPRKDTFRF